jgi:hypothetical protein
MESLEIRCNQSAITPLADFSAEPAPVVQLGTETAEVGALVVDPTNPISAGVGGALPTVPVVDLQLDQHGEVMATH